MKVIAPCNEPCNEMSHDDPCKENALRTLADGAVCDGEENVPSPCEEEHNDADTGDSACSRTAARLKKRMRILALVVVCACGAAATAALAADVHGATLVRQDVPFHPVLGEPHAGELVVASWPAHAGQVLTNSHVLADPGRGGFQSDGGSSSAHERTTRHNAIHSRSQDTVPTLSQDDLAVRSHPRLTWSRWGNA